MASSTLYDGTVPSSVRDRNGTGTRLPSRRQGSGRWTVLNSLRGLAEGWQSFRRWQALESMSDRQLKHLGIDRGDIPRIAVFGTAETTDR